MSYQQEWREQYQRLNEYTDALERKVERMVYKLKMISQGYVPGDWEKDTESGMKMLAANCLADEAKEPKFNRPWRSL